MQRKKSLLVMIAVLILVGAVASLAEELSSQGAAPTLQMPAAATCSPVESTIPVEPFAKPHPVNTCGQACSVGTNCRKLCGDFAFCNITPHQAFGHCEFQ